MLLDGTTVVRVEFQVQSEAKKQFFDYFDFSRDKDKDNKLKGIFSYI